MLKVLVNKRVS